MRREMRKWLLLIIMTVSIGHMISDKVVSAEENMVNSFLTGKLVPESIGRQRPVAVTYNNIEAALPQSGISNAEVVYEAPVEGGITRLLGIHEDYRHLERIGSVRSCRDYFIYFAREFDAYYMHYGQAVYALDLLEHPATLNIDGMRGGAGAYYRSDDFAAPHNVYTNYVLIQETLGKLGYSKEYAQNYLSGNGHYEFAGDGEGVMLSSGQDAFMVSPGYTYNDAYFLYDAASEKYIRYQYGAPHVDKLTENPLEYDNIIFQYCPWENYDANGYLNIDTLSGGEGKFITKGKSVDITWNKDLIDRNDKYADVNFGVTHYYDADGNEIVLNQGKTWVCIIQDTYCDRVSIRSEQ